MPITIDEEVRIWNQQLQILCREYNRHDIEEDEYVKKFKELDDKIKSKTKSLISNMILDRQTKEEKQKEEHLRRMANMTEEIKPEVKVAKVPKVAKEKVAKVSKEKTPKKDSRASIILDVLQMKTIKNIEAATDKVCEKIPGSNKSNVKSQINTIVKLVQNKKSYFANYTWDDANYQLTKNQ